MKSKISLKVKEESIGRELLFRLLFLDPELSYCHTKYKLGAKRMSARIRILRLTESASDLSTTTDLDPTFVSITARLGLADQYSLRNHLKNSTI